MIFYYYQYQITLTDKIQFIKKRIKIVLINEDLGL